MGNVFPKIVILRVNISTKEGVVVTDTTLMCAFALFADSQTQRHKLCRKLNELIT